MEQSGIGPVERGPGGAVDWSAALAEHARWLRRVVWTRVGEPHAVDEVMQEVSLAAVAQDGAVRAEQAPAWLYRVAVRQALLYRRKCGRRRKLHEGYAQRQQQRDSAAAATTDEASPLDWLLAAERNELVRQALERLPRRDADVLVLKYTENWSYRQLAEHLGMTVSAVESRLHRARKKLRELLTQMKVNEDQP